MDALKSKSWSVVTTLYSSLLELRDSLPGCSNSGLLDIIVIWCFKDQSKKKLQHSLRKILRLKVYLEDFSPLTFTFSSNFMHFTFYILPFTLYMLLFVFYIMHFAICFLL